MSHLIHVRNGALIFNIISCFSNMLNIYVIIFFFKFAQKTEGCHKTTAGFSESENSFVTTP